MFEEKPNMVLNLAHYAQWHMQSKNNEFDHNLLSPLLKPYSPFVFMDSHTVWIRSKHVAKPSLQDSTHGSAIQKHNESQWLKFQPPGRLYALWFVLSFAPKASSPTCSCLFICRTCEGQNIKYRTCSNVVSWANSSLCNGRPWSFQVFFSWDKLIRHIVIKNSVWWNCENILRVYGEEV